MKAVKYQGTEEKTVLTGLIVNDRVLGQALPASRDKRGPFKSRWSNLIARWCFEHHQKHRKAPGALIQRICADRMQNEDPETIQLVESFLDTLSGEWEKLEEQLSEEWLLAKTSEHFRKVQLERISEEMSAALDSGDLPKAEEVFSEGKQSGSMARKHHNPFSDSNIQAVVEGMEKDKPLVEFGGDLGRFLSPYFERGAFISFAAPEKKGKSFWLQEVVWKALNQHRRVLYYVLGDMSEHQVDRRMFSRMTGKPRKRTTVKMPQSLRIIKSKNREEMPTAEVESQDSEMNPFTARDIKLAIKRLRTQAARKMMPLRTYVMGAGTFSASQIEQEVRTLSDDGFIPDLVVIDYADLMAPEPESSRLDFRHQIDASWKILRRIALDNHLLVVTATQAAARSYDRWLLKKNDFSEDKRKNAHVSGMLGINQTPSEKTKGVYRLNWIFLRDGEWTETQCVWTAGSLAVGCPCFKSLL